MPRPKVEVQEDLSANATLQTKVAVKIVLKKEQVRRMENGEGSATMSDLVAAALSAYFKNPEYDKILRKAGLIE